MGLDLDAINTLIAGKGMKKSEEKTLLAALLQEKPAMLSQIVQLLLQQRRDTQKELGRVEIREKKARIAEKKAEELIAKLMSPPLHPAAVLRLEPEGRIQVVCDGRRLVVATLPGFDAGELRAGDEILLDTDSGYAVSRAQGQERAGAVGVVSEVSDAGVMVRGAADEEIVAMATPELSAQLKPGDRVLYRRDFPCLISRLSERKQSRFLFEDTPKESFEDIGGLGELIGEVRDVLDLHLHHPELVDKYRLDLLRGITLVGPPGVGKTLFARTIANYLATSGGGKASFIHVKPGEFRGMFYGQAEGRIRELFAAARAAGGIVVIFFDELDSYGNRGEGIGQDIDGRVLGSFLSEIDGLEQTRNVVCIGATNRLDLCDAALIRKKRMGDRIYTIPRPQREATLEILARHLEHDLAYADQGAEALTAAATSYLHATEGGAGVLATVTFRNGDTREIRARDVISGALLASAVSDAKHAAARREVEAALYAEESDRETEGAVGISYEDLLTALDAALAAELEKISVPHVARRTLDVPHADEIARVEVATPQRVSLHSHLRAA